MVINKIFSKKNKALLSELVRTDFKLRYQGSLLGYAWSLLRPLLLFLILYIVFVKFLKFGGGIPNYPVYLLLGIVFWTFFSEMTSMCLGSVVGRGDLIRKIRIPRWIIVLSSSISALINFSLNLMVVSVFMVISGLTISQNVLFLPLIIFELYIFAFGLSLILATAFVKFRDVVYIWEVVMQAMFYLTPILYPLTLISNPLYQKILLISPIAQIIQDARQILVTNHTLTIAEVFGTRLARAIPITIALTTLIIGVWYFKRESRTFAENL